MGLTLQNRLSSFVFTCLLGSHYSINCLADPSTYNLALRKVIQAAPFTQDEKISHVLNRLGFGSTSTQVKQIRSDKRGVEAALADYIETQISPPDFLAYNGIEPGVISREVAKFPACDGNIEAIVLKGTKPKSTEICFLPSLTDDKFLKYFSYVSDRINACAALEREPNCSNWPSQDQCAATQTLCGSTQHSDQKIRLARIRDFIQVETYRQSLWYTILIAIHSKYPLRERVKFLDFNHFNVDWNKVMENLIPYEKIFRENAFGEFENTLLRTAQSPAMLTYLDNESNTYKRYGLQEGINENYAREILELHTLGPYLSEYAARIGGYNQRELRDVARILTGWGLDAKGSFKFRKLSHDGRNSKLLESKIFGSLFSVAAGPACKAADTGQTAACTVEDIAAGKPGCEVTDCSSKIIDGENLIGHLARVRATAHRVIEKILDHFLYERVGSGEEGITAYRAVRERLVTKFLKSGSDAARKSHQMRDVYAELFLSPEFWSRTAFKSRVRDPLSFGVATMRRSQSSAAPMRYEQLHEVGGLFDRFQDLLKQGEEPIYRFPFPTGFSTSNSKWGSPSHLLAYTQFLASTRNNLSYFEDFATASPLTQDSIIQLSKDLTGFSVSPETSLQIFKEISGITNQRDALTKARFLILLSPENLTQ